MKKLSHGVFTLSLFPLVFCRRIDDDMGRTHELEHSAIKCMRGILYCYMRQADKVSSCLQHLTDQRSVCSSEPLSAAAPDTSGSSFM